MKPKLQEYALFAEVISGLAVLVTLIFLVVSIRDDANATRTAVYEQLLDSLNDFNNVIMQDDRLASLWLTRRDLDVDSLSDQDVRKLTLMFRTVMRTLDAAFSASQYHTIGQSEVDRLLDSACNTYSTLLKVNATLEPDIFVPISQEFRDFLGTSCAGGRYETEQ